MNVIYKFILSPGLGNCAVEVEMPVDATIISLQVQNGVPCIWAQVNPDAEKETRTFVIYGTGHQVILPPQQHIGTVQSSDGDVWHIYEKF